MPKRKVTEIMILDKLERQTQIIVVLILHLYQMI